MTDTMKTETETFTSTMPLDYLLHATQKVHDKMHVVLYECEGFEEETGEETDWSKMLDLAEQLCELSLAIKERAEREEEDANWRNGNMRPLGEVWKELIRKESRRPCDECKTSCKQCCGLEDDEGKEMWRCSLCCCGVKIETH
jgi:hypothetical protein